MRQEIVLIITPHDVISLKNLLCINNQVWVGLFVSIIVATVVLYGLGVAIKRINVSSANNDDNGFSTLENSFKYIIRLICNQGINHIFFIDRFRIFLLFSVSRWGSGFWPLASNQNFSWNLVSRLFYPYNGLQQCPHFFHRLSKFETGYRFN